MWHCPECDIEITKPKKNRHLKSARHQKNIGNNPYHLGKIYKIICNDTGKIYIGSTIRHRIEDRLIEHKCDKKQYELGKSYSHIRSSYQLLDNCRIELIEEVKCENVDELRTREQYHIENNECVNFIRSAGFCPIGYSKEYREKNKDKIAEREKEYREKNKEKIVQIQKEYREKNKEKIKAHKGRVVICECGVSYTHNHASRHKRSNHHMNYNENVKI